MDVAAVPWPVTLRRPFITALGAKQISPNVLVRVRLANGVTGYGEGSASLAMPTETQPAMLRAIRSLGPSLCGADVGEWAALIRRLWERTDHPTAISAVEIALCDAFTRARRVPLYQWFGGATTSVVTGLTISAWPKAQAVAVARDAVRRGFRQLKIKIGTDDLEEDLARVLAVHRAAPRATILLDANQGLTVHRAERLIAALRRARVPITLLEQPVPSDDLRGLAYLARRLGLPIAVDETVRTPADALAVVQRRAAHVINIKLAKSGVLGALAIIAIARAAGVRLMIGCMAESRVGLSASVHLACGTGAFDYVDLDSAHLTYAVPASGGFTTHGPRLSVCSHRAGTGLTSVPVPLVPGTAYRVPRGQVRMG